MFALLTTIWLAPAHACTPPQDFAYAQSATTTDDCLTAAIPSSKEVVRLTNRCFDGRLLGPRVPDSEDGVQWALVDQDFLMGTTVELVVQEYIFGESILGFDLSDGGDQQVQVTVEIAVETIGGCPPDEEPPGCSTTGGAFGGAWLLLVVVGCLRREPWARSSSWVGA